MIVIVCIDDRGGMLFNHRRLSKDRDLRKKIIERVGSGKLYMNSYSFGQFEKEYADRITVAENFLELAGTGDFCFVETEPLTEFANKIERIVLYRWNRVYPSDLKLDIRTEEWKLESTEEFVGHSHPKITEELYSR